jgi:ATP-binding protein involved in chromosome partitioning
MSSSIGADEVRQALRDVKVPGTSVDILSLDLVGEIKVEGGEVLVTIVRTSETEKTIAAVQTGVKARVAELPGINSVQTVVDDRSAAASGPARGPHGQSPDPFADRSELPGVKQIIAVASAKGGVGKSSVAVNLALALRDRGHAVGLLDADVYGPSVPTMLGPIGAPQITDDKKIEPAVVHELQVISMGLLMPADQPVIWRGPLVFAAVKQFLKDVVWSERDYLVVDLPPGTGDAQLTLVQQVPLAGVVMVTTPQEVALADVRRGIGMFRSVEVPVLGIVENMSYFVCPGSAERHHIFGEGGGARVAGEYGLPLLGEIPIDPAIRVGGDEGRPAVLVADSPAREAFLQLADRVIAGARKPD